MAKNPKKTLQILILLSILIGLVAIAVGIIALAKQEYIIAVAMILVAAWQVVNYKKWKKSYKNRYIRRNFQPHPPGASGTRQLFVRGELGG